MPFTCSFSKSGLWMNHLGKVTHHLRNRNDKEHSRSSILKSELVLRKSFIDSLIYTMKEQWKKPVFFFPLWSWWHLRVLCFYHTWSCSDWVREYIKVISYQGRKWCYHLGLCPLASRSKCVFFISKGFLHISILSQPLACDGVQFDWLILILVFHTR